ncbi:hypothetical protein GCM10027408_13410 [Microbacterium tumbae]
MRGAALVVALALAASALPAASAVASTIEAEPADAIETRVQVSYPVLGDVTIYLLGEPAPVSATVTPAGATGTVDFFDGDVPLGSAPVDAAGRAAIETEAWGGPGERSVTARFLPDSEAHRASESAAMTYRIVDTARMVPEAAVGDASAEIVDASLDWTIANIWFSNFSVGFEREVLSGDVTLPASSPGGTLEELRAYYSRPFTFHGGSGTRDAGGDALLAFRGSVQLTSGSANRWVFTDPEVLLGADGSGYVTAEFSGYYRLGSLDQSYGPVRVAIATFSDAVADRGEDGDVAVRAPLNWEGQANGQGTWAPGFDASFPNEFVALLNPGINLFFAASGVATDSSKAPLPLAISYREEQIPAPPTILSPPQDTVVGEGGDARFRVRLDAASGYVVRWQERIDGAWADLPGTSGESLLLSGVLASQSGTSYRAVIEGDGFRLFSEPAVLTVIPVDDDAAGGDDEAAGEDGADAGGDGADAGGAGPEAPRGSALAATGVDPTGAVIAGGFALVAGLVLMVLRRRVR